MAVLHVVPDERGNWRDFEDAQPAPLSEHWTATYAEFAALSHARAQGAQEVVVHDRYGRTHQPCATSTPGAPSTGPAAREDSTHVPRRLRGWPEPEGDRRREGSRGTARRSGADA